MSRASYASWADKARVDKKAAENLALAQALSETVGRQKSQASREQQLGIIPPPAQFQSAAEAAADLAHANQKAVLMLETFMYPKDANQAFGDLLKHDQIAEFNQYGSQFKSFIGDKKLSYIEFINLWHQFLDYLSGERSSKILYLTPEEKTEYEANLKINEDKFNLPEYEPLPIKSSERGGIDDNVLLLENDKPVDFTKLSRSEIEGMDQNKSNSVLRLVNFHKRFNIMLPHGLKYNSSKEISKQSGPTLRNNVNLLKKSLLEHDTNDHPFGKGFRRIKGRGISDHQSKDQTIRRFKICQGEIIAGNNNPDLIRETRQLITKLKEDGLLKYK